MTEFLTERKPDYIIRHYRNNLYGIVRLNVSDYDNWYKEKPDTYDKRLDNSLCRSRRMILEYGLCNDWDWFVTFTISPDKYDRYSLERYRISLRQWIMDMRKRYNKAKCKPKRLSYLLVPEMHRDGAWHVHGLMSGIPPCELRKFEKFKAPAKLVDGGYLNWTSYADKYGFCSLAKIRDAEAATYYLQKYLTKQMNDLDAYQNKHVYFASRPLNTSTLYGTVYGRYPELDDLLSIENKFCAKGFVKTSDWSWYSEFIEQPEDMKIVTVDDMPDDDLSPEIVKIPDIEPNYVDPSYDYTSFQLMLSELAEVKY